MDPSTLYNDEHIQSYLPKSQSLETAYQESLRNAELIVNDETARRLRLHILILESGNDDLHEKLALADDRIDVLEQEADQLRAQLEHSQKDAYSHENVIRAQTRELANLKAELTSMNGVTIDASKLLTEKLSIARELATIKPELEHLRSQSAFQQTVLSEKLALQRQVSTLEVELEAEKQASKRAVQKNNSSNDREAKLQNQVEELQKELAREKRVAEKACKDVGNQLKASEARQAVLESKVEQIGESDRVCKDTEKELRASEARQIVLENKLEQARKAEKAQKDVEKDVEKEFKASKAREAVLESKLDQLRTTLRLSKEKLKTCQTELTQAVAAATKGETMRGVAGMNPRKRGVREMNTDEAIGTPDGVAVRGKRPVVKKGRMDQTMVGEKSMFSITPFLNRAVNMALDTPAKDMDNEGTEHEVEKVDPTEVDQYKQPEPSIDVSSPFIIPQAKSKKKVTRKTSTAERKILGEVKMGTKNKKPAPEESHAISTLEKVTEEEVDENELLDVVPTMVETTNPKHPCKTASAKLFNAQLKHSSNDETLQTKKKRKLLGGSGKTLFDGEDGEAAKRPTKLALGPPRLMAKGNLAAPKAGLKGDLGSACGFGGFSPLKKDRRGCGASFLA